MKNIEERLVAEVPKQIDILKAKGGPDDSDRKRASLVPALIAKEGRPLMFGGNDAKAEELFTELVFNLAVSAFSPGGATLCGIKWEVKA